MINTHEIKNKIISSIEKRGPSLPIQIAKELAMNSLFVAAFLSELNDEKRLKVSSLKVGGSPLYFLTGQEEQLEKFYKFLHPKEAEAFELLRKNKILKDRDQDPAIRVALRAIKDFSVAFKDNEEVYWRYILVPEQEVVELFNKQALIIKEPIKKNLIESNPQPIKTTNFNASESADSELAITSDPIESNLTIKKPKKEIKREIKQIEIFENPLVPIEIEKPKKEKPKSEFVLNIIKLIEDNKWKIIEEKEHKSKEYLCIVQINFDLGPINFLTTAKDKKSVSDLDLKKHLSDAQKIPLPALFLYTGTLSKKAKEYENQYFSILKTKKIE